MTPTDLWILFLLENIWSDETVAHTPSERICIEESVSLHMSCASVNVQSCRKALSLRRRGTLAARCFRLKHQTLSLDLHLHKIFIDLSFYTLWKNLVQKFFFFLCLLSVERCILLILVTWWWKLIKILSSYHLTCAKKIIKEPHPPTTMCFSHLLIAATRSQMKHLHWVFFWASSPLQHCQLVRRSPACMGFSMKQ